ncbi:zf-RVT domain-containing protein [Cucumis melo var. makuwa]|uniref:Zf-RVT domain-containing protein n=1 Tax=Cucumis melo var. makuwa TaxID=1194695 RepID=A0A5A7V9E0_CUCMM|nr:zf-RVT domain-containing protein [Cucumis melo var. makuwa]TYK28207.1 zf-RVT domain-containing protein [Cucumis melo var. makuwa]
MNPQDDMSKVIPSKRDDLANVACRDVVLESFKQLEKGKIRSSPNRPSRHVEDFLFGLLFAISTPLRFISWIKACVTSLKFYILIMALWRGLPRLSSFINVVRSSMFVARVSSEAASLLASNLGFALGQLPVGYLGIPLLFGRLQLVRPVLHSFQVYWASVFVLLASVHHEVDKILKSYLWRGKEDGRGGVKVAWTEGGPILEHVGERVLYDATSRREARVSKFLGPDEQWSVRDRWVWVHGRPSGFLIVSTYDTIRFEVFGFVGLVYCREGEMFPNIPFVGIGKGVGRKQWRILCYATIYFIWKEHNHHLHGGQARDPIVLFQLIQTCICAHVVSWRKDAQDLI